MEYRRNRLLLRYLTPYNLNIVIFRMSLYNMPLERK